jgi:hypothetical protein
MMAQHAATPTDLAPIGPDEAEAILTEHAQNEQRMLDESGEIVHTPTPSEHLRDALQILVFLSELAEGSKEIVINRQAFASLVENLSIALGKAELLLEVAHITREIDRKPESFALRYLRLQQRVAAVEKRILSFHGSIR